MRIVLCSVPCAEAKNLARGILMKHLAGCVQIVPLVESFYWWDGQLCEDQEALLICKTDISVVPALTSHIKEYHSYELPEVVSIQLEGNEGNLDYLSWLFKEVSTGK